MTVEPVVVTPDIDSKKALASVMPSTASKKGKEPKTAIVSQIATVMTKASFSERFDFLPCVVKRRATPMNKVIKADDRKACQSTDLSAKAIRAVKVIATARMIIKTPTIKATGLKSIKCLLALLMQFCFQRITIKTKAGAVSTSYVGVSLTTCSK